jgi:hypothetical protein
MAYDDYDPNNPQPRHLTNVVRGRNPEGQGGLEMSDVAALAQGAGGAVGRGAMDFFRGLRDPREQSGALGMAGQFLGNIGRRLPAAYTAGRGNQGAASAMMQNVGAEERGAAMAHALSGLDPTNPDDVQQIAQIAMQFGDTGTAMAIMQMIESGELARMKAAQAAPKMRTRGGVVEGEAWIFNDEWNPYTQEWEEVGGAPKSGGVNIDLGGAMDQHRASVFEEVKAETGDTSLALSAISESPKAYKDPTTNLWAAGAEAERGKARERQGYIESLTDFLGVLDEMQQLQLSTNLPAEWWEGAQQTVGEGAAYFNRFNQIRQELLTQYVKARSGAQVSDREIQRYEAQFPKYRDLMDRGILKEGGKAMVNGLISNGEAMVRSALPHKTRDQGSEIYYTKLGRRGYEGILEARLPDPVEVLGDLSGRTEPPRPINTLKGKDLDRFLAIADKVIDGLEDPTINPLLIETEIAKAARREGLDIDFTLGGLGVYE